jgi:hypothetical protein
MSTMNEETVNQLAQDLLNLLAEEKIPVKRMAVAILVPMTYIKTIISNFPRRGRSVHDLAVTVWGDTWDITIGIAIFPKKPDEQTGDTPQVQTNNETSDSENVPMDEKRVVEIISKIKSDLKRYEMDVAGWQVIAIVTAEFFESVKHDLATSSQDDLLIVNDDHSVGVRQYNRFTFFFKPSPRSS